MRACLCFVQCICMYMCVSLLVFVCVVQSVWLYVCVSVDLSVSVSLMFVFRDMHRCFFHSRHLCRLLRVPLSWSMSSFASSSIAICLFVCVPVCVPVYLSLCSLSVTHTLRHFNAIRSICHSCIG